MNACADCSVRERAICHSLPLDELAGLNRLGRHQTLRRGQTLMWQGEEAQMVGNVLEGTLKLSASSFDGRDQTLGIMLPGDFIGRPFGRTSTHSVTALTDARVCTFSRTAFDAFAGEHPPLEHGLLEHTLTELDRARQWKMLLGRKSASERMAIFLLEMADRCLAEGVGNVPVRFDLPVSRQDIADLLGLTIETVSRQITHLRDEKVIETPGRRTIVLLDREALKRRTGEE